MAHATYDDTNLDGEIVFRHGLESRAEGMRRSSADLELLRARQAFTHSFQYATQGQSFFGVKNRRESNFKVANIVINGVLANFVHGTCDSIWIESNIKLDK